MLTSRSVDKSVRAFQRCDPVSVGLVKLHPRSPRLAAPGLQKPSVGAGVSIENGRRMTSKQSEEHLWMGRRDLPRLNAGSFSYHLRASGALSTGNG
jgi:hypothetical protein